jgi:hypothetical protein
VQAESEAEGNLSFLDAPACSFPPTENNSDADVSGRLWYVIFACFFINSKMTFPFAFGCGISIAHQERQDRPLAWSCKKLQKYYHHGAWKHGCKGRQVKVLKSEGLREARTGHLQMHVRSSTVPSLVASSSSCHIYDVDIIYLCKQHAFVHTGAGTVSSLAHFAR